jgi:hypothetical protein
MSGDFNLAIDRVGRGINGHEEIPVGGQLTSLLAVS